MIAYISPFEVVVGIGAAICVFGMPLALLIFVFSKILDL